MNRIPIVTRVTAIIAIAAGVALALALPAGANVSQLSPPIAAVQVGSPATLGARGAVVTVPVTVVCAPGGTGDVFVEVAQRHGNDISRGFGGASSGPCTGGFQTVDVVVVAFDSPFHKGTAFAIADFSVCDFTGCARSRDQREIEIVR